MAARPERDAINAELKMLRNSIPLAAEVLPEQGVGHSLAHWTGILTGGYVPDYLDIVSTWPAEQVR